MQISGRFNVKMIPSETTIPSAQGNTFGRFLLDKQYEGEMNGESTGEMISAMTSVKGSAGYVAIEHFSGTVTGRKGTMALQHFGIMHAGMNRLILEVIPESGTDGLKGITGTMQIRIENGGHFYDFDFQLTN